MKSNPWLSLHHYTTICPLRAWDFCVIHSKETSFTKVTEKLRNTKLTHLNQEKLLSLSSQITPIFHGKVGPYRHTLIRLSASYVFGIGPVKYIITAILFLSIEETVSRYRDTRFHEISNVNNTIKPKGIYIFSLMDSYSIHLKNSVYYINYCRGI